MITSLWEDIKEAIFPIAHAEEEADAEVGDNEAQVESTESEEQPEEAEEAEEQPEEEAEEEAEEQPEEEAEEEAEEDEDEDEDEDDDDEEETVDPLVTLREKYSHTVCHDAKHHFDECVERVTAEMERDDYEELAYKEDCVEEFFHLNHCLDEHTSKTLFSKLR